MVEHVPAGSLAIEMNRLALKRILASMIAMAGLARFLPSPLRGGSARSDGVGVPTLTRSLRLAVLSILRPAEAATRRLIIALAPRLPPLSITVDDSRPLRRFAPPPPLRRGGSAAATPEASPSASPAPISFRMLDPLRSPFVRRRWIRPTAIPRISSFDAPRARLVLPQPPLPTDPMDAAPIARRLAALGRALDDLPARAQRFARWRARALGFRDAGHAVRVSPLRPGRPPGGRLSSYDPDRPRRKRIREVDAVLAHAHSLAWEALRPPDSS